MARPSTAKALDALAPARDHDYADLIKAVERSFRARTADAAVLFKTNTRSVFEAYLGALPGDSDDRQVHDCHACRHFLERYGDLVTVDGKGVLVPVMWDVADVPPFYRLVFKALDARVRSSRIVSPFYTRETVWGTPVTGNWTHMAVRPRPALVHQDRALTPDQAAAAVRESYKDVVVALEEFSPEVLDQALRVLASDQLYRSEKFLGPVQWLRDLPGRPTTLRKENLLWHAVATAPTGYCHPRASVVGSLLEDIAAGKTFHVVKSRFNAKVRPTRYQRPQAPPAEGNVQAATKLIAKLGLSRSLERRFARLEEVPTVWSPVPEKEAAPVTGIFANVPTKPRYRPATPRPVDLTAATRVMTWVKFADRVMPGAERMRLVVPGHGRFIALTTAVHPDAPPILKWDHEDERNPLAWYVYPKGSGARQWGLTPGFAAEVTGVSLFPNMTGTRPTPELSTGVILRLEGAKDLHGGASAGLFPEILKGGLHAVRSTIEAYSKTARLGGVQEASACGYDLRTSAADAELRVFDGGCWGTYRIDRWD
jgi:hypothetical protein